MNLKKMSGTRFFLILASILCSATSANAQLVERPLISGRHAVVTSDEPLASMAGMRILQKGGNAFDAAVATAAAVGVLDPRMSSIGGNGFATVYVSRPKRCARSTSMDPRQSEPAASGRCCEQYKAAREPARSV
jgi:gamma-glutamyltranspeptidase/glutathione hydrolase